MQNEELRRTQKELEEYHDRFLDLYDFSPVGYFSFDENGLIMEVNLTGANKLGVERKKLIKKPFSRFLSPDSKDALYLHLRHVFRTGIRQTCELKVVDKKGVQLDVQLIQESQGNTKGAGLDLRLQSNLLNCTEEKYGHRVNMGRGPRSLLRCLLR
jgi:PAS domain S-box-containing protein